MSEVPRPREFDPSDREAGPESIRLFKQAIEDAILMNADERGYYEPTLGGSCSITIDDEKVDSLHLDCRALGAEDAPPIFEWLTKKEIPHATTYWIRMREEFNRTNDPLTRHIEIEEMWIQQLEGEVQLRRRVYDHEIFNYELQNRVSNPEYNQLMAQFEQRKEMLIRKQEQSDREEESLGLNRVTEAQIQEFISLLKDLTPEE